MIWKEEKKMIDWYWLDWLLLKINFCLFYCTSNIDTMQKFNVWQNLSIMVLMSQFIIDSLRISITVIDQITRLETTSTNILGFTSLFAIYDTRKSLALSCSSTHVQPSSLISALSWNKINNRVSVLLISFALGNKCKTSVDLGVRQKELPVVYANKVVSYKKKRINTK